MVAEALAGFEASLVVGDLGSALAVAAAAEQACGAVGVAAEGYWGEVV